MNLTYEQFAKAFKYNRSGIKDLRIDTIGDCRTYALTTAYIMAGHSRILALLQVIFFRHWIWFVITPKGELHTATYRPGKGWACNIYRELGKLRHWPIFPINPTLIAAAIAAWYYL